MIFKKILLPIDGSTNSEKVIKYAVAIAKQEGSEIFILNVVDSKRLTSVPEETIENDEVDFDEHSSLITQKVADIIRESDLETEFNIVTMTVEGHPVEAIQKVAEKENVDLIIMTSSGKHIIDRFLLGSVTEKTIRISKVPVLMVPTCPNK